jgi:hypothetical protein
LTANVKNFFAESLNREWLHRCTVNRCNDLTIQRFNDGLHHAPDADAVHAAEINWAFAQKTWRAGCVGFQQA